MVDGADNPGGIMAAARRLGTSLLGLLQTRAELFAVELQEEKLRALRLLAWLTAAVALGVAAILMAVATLALFLWQNAGYAGLIGLTVAVLAAAITLFAVIHRRIVHGPEPFAATVAEFRKDAECLRRNE
ncbi:MAG: phage holin family protein [Opitutaceae bacterium]|nr:phage holin family protein [Opitutaceae bacterium]